jgi:hypothetical protein
MSYVRTSYSRFGNARACLRNMRALLYAVAAKPFFTLKARDPLRFTGHVTASKLHLPPPPNREAGFKAMGHVVALESSRAVRRDPKPWDI